MYTRGSRAYVPDKEIVIEDTITHDMFIDCADAVEHKFVNTYGDDTNSIQMYKPYLENREAFINSLSMMYNNSIGEKWFDDYLKIIYMVHQDMKLPVKQIADRIGMGQVTARKRIVRANQQLVLYLKANKDILVGPMSTIEFFMNTAVPTQVGKAILRHIPRAHKTKNMYFFVEKYYIEDVKRIRGIGITGYERLVDGLNSIGLKLIHYPIEEHEQTKHDCVNAIIDQLRKLYTMNDISEFKLDRIYRMVKNL